MSEFSESYHLFTTNQEGAVKLIRACGLRGFVLAPENGWVSFVVEDGSFEPDPRVTEQNQSCLLHYVNAEDHGWNFELFEGSRSVCRYRCDWDNEVRPDMSDFRPAEVSRLLGSEIAGRLAEVTPQFTPQSIDELFEHETAYDFARALSLPHYEWFSYDGGLVVMNEEIKIMLAISKFRRRRPNYAAAFDAPTRVSLRWLPQGRRALPVWRAVWIRCARGRCFAHSAVGSPKPLDGKVRYDCV